MDYRFFAFKSSQIHYSISGQGEKKIVCLHGYGESLYTYGFLQSDPSLQAYTVIAIDLPHHGKTEWREAEAITTEELWNIIEGIATLHAPGKSTVNQSWTLAGYSMGGRIALSLFQHKPGQVGKMLLMAPDGLKINFWYWLATQTRGGNRFFAFTMKHPQWFFALVKLMHKTGLVNPSILKFTNYYISDPVVRQQLYDRWTTLRKFKPDLSQIKKEINKHHTKVRLLYGKHDRIILSSIGKKFCKGIETHCQLTEIHAGHQVLHEKHAKEILPAFRQ